MVYLTKYNHRSLLFSNAITNLTLLWFKNLDKQGETKWILVVVVNERNPVNVCYRRHQFISKQEI